MIIHFSFFALFSAGKYECLHTIFSAFGLWQLILYLYILRLLFIAWWYIEFYDILKDYDAERLKYELFKYLDE